MFELLLPFVFTSPFFFLKSTNAVSIYARRAFVSRAGEPAQKHRRIGAAARTKCRVAGSQTRHFEVNQDLG